MKNAYEVRGETTVIIIESPKYGRLEALISTSKLERAREYPNRWMIKYRERTKTFYVVGTMTDEHGKRHDNIYLHRWITGAPDGMVVDHIDHNTLNNTDANLRIITNAQNQQNRKGPNSKSKSGVRGVWWHKKAKKWYAQIEVNRKMIRLGLFVNIEEAEQAVTEAREKHMPYSQEASA